MAHLETPTYLRLFGAEVASAEVIGLLQQPGPPWIISIGGMGGLGKTALADYVVRQVVRNGKLEGVAWITARRERLNPGGTLRASDGATVTVDTLWDLLAAQVLSDLPAETHWSDAKRREMVLQRLRNAEHLVVIDISPREHENDHAHIIDALISADIAPGLVEMGGKEGAVFMRGLRCSRRPQRRW